MAERRRGLGRGLGALIPSAPQEDTAAATSVTAGEPTPEVTATVPGVPERTASASSEVPGAAGESMDDTESALTAPAPDDEGVAGRGSGTEGFPEEPLTPVDTADPRAETAPDTETEDEKASDRGDATRTEHASTSASDTGGTTGRLSRTSGRTKRPVDVFFDGAPKQRAGGAIAGAGDFGEGTAPAASANRSSSGSKDRRGRRSVSAEAMENALTRGSRGGRSLGSRSPGTENANGDSRPAPLDPSVTDTAVAPSSTAVDESGEPDTGAGERVSRETLVEVPGAIFAEIPVVDIQPNPRQPRSVFDEDEMGELVHSIRTIGVLQPIVVRRRPVGSGYELVMGERRWRATQRAGLETIPAIVRTTEDTDMLRDALLENLHRSQLNPLEEAAAYQQLLDDFAATHDELATRIGRSRPQISNTLRLLQLPPLVQRRVAAGVLSAGHARALLSLADAGEIEKLAQRIVSEGLSVRATEEVVAMSDGLKRSTRATPRNSVRHERLDYLANSLSDYLDTSVKVSLGARKGKVSIEFGSVEDLNRIIDLISPDARQ